MMCDKCGALSGILILALGVAYLLVDLGVWGFFGVKWYSALFLLLGVMWLGKASCQMCCEKQCSMPKASPKKKRRK